MSDEWKKCKQTLFAWLIIKLLACECVLLCATIRSKPFRSPETCNATPFENNGLVSDTYIDLRSVKARKAVYIFLGLRLGIRMFWCHTIKPKMIGKEHMLSIDRTWCHTLSLPICCHISPKKKWFIAKIYAQYTHK